MYKSILARPQFEETRIKYEEMVNEFKHKFVTEYGKLNLKTNELISEPIKKLKKIETDLLSEVPNFIGKANEISMDLDDILLKLKENEKKQTDLIQKINNKFKNKIKDTPDFLKNFAKYNGEIKKLKNEEENYIQAMEQVKNYKQDIKDIEAKKKDLDEFIKGK